MTGESYIPINIWVLPKRTVRHSRADCPEAGCYKDATNLIGDEGVVIVGTTAVLQGAARAI